MANSDSEDEDIISQDDIDALLESSAMDEESMDDLSLDLDDDAGDLSQDDIDSLMGGLDLSDGEAADDDGEFDQDDIDALLEGDEFDEGGAGEEEDDDEFISQDDVLQFLNSEAAATTASGPTLSDENQENEAPEEGGQDAATDPGDEELPGEPESDLDEFDLDELDLDELDSEPSQTAGDTSDEGESSPLDGDELEALTLEDGDTAASDDEVVVDAPGAETSDEADVVDISLEDDDDGYLIDGSQALPIEENLVSQDALDELLSAFSEKESQVAPEDEGAQGPMEEGDAPLEIDLDDGELDLDALDIGEPAGDGADGEELDGDDLDGDTVSQEDIDALLMESEGEEDALEDEDDILISQDDIDTLLQAADQEDEDVLGDIMEDMGDDDLDDVNLDEGFEDDDLFELDEDDPGENPLDQVVLEAPVDVEDSLDPPPEKSRLKTIVLALVGVILVLGVSVPTAYFLFFSGEDGVVVDEAVPLVAVQEKEGGAQVVTPDSGTAEPVAMVRKSGSLLLSDFVIMASDRARDMAYITTDVVIDYSDQRAYHEINDNLPFYRDLIYETLRKNLVWEKRNQVTEADLLWEIENSIKKVLPPHYIDQVSFKSFKIT